MITALEIYEDVREAYEAVFEALKINTDQQIEMKISPAGVQELIDSLPKSTDVPMIWKVDPKRLDVIYSVSEVLINSCTEALKLAVQFDDKDAKEAAIQLGHRIEFAVMVLRHTNRGFRG